MRTYTPKARRHHARLARDRRRRRDPRPPRHRDRHLAARQAQADLGAAHRRRRPRRDRERRRSSRSGRASCCRRRTTATAGTRAVSAARASSTCSRAIPEKVIKLAVRRMLPKGPLGRQMLRKLQGVRRPDASAPGAATRNVRPLPERSKARIDRVRRKGCIVSKPLIQTTGRRKEAVARVRLRPGTGKIIVNGRRVRGVLPDPHAPGHREGAAAAHADRRGLRRRRHARRRRGQRPGRCDPPRYRPRARCARPRVARRAEEGRPPAARRAREGTAQVRPQEGAQGSAVLEAVALRRSACCASEPTASAATPTHDLTTPLVVALGRAVARVLRPARMLIGRDTRDVGTAHRGRASSSVWRARSSKSSRWACCRRRRSRSSAAQPGVPAAIVSASHNPWSDNGVKVIGRRRPQAARRRGSRDRSRARLELASIWERRAVRRTTFVADRERADAYIAHLLATLEGRTLDGLRCGARLRERRGVRRSALEVFRGAGAEVFAMHDKPDGRNINDECGSTHPEIAPGAKSSSAVLHSVSRSTATATVCSPSTSTARSSTATRS